MMREQVSSVATHMHIPSWYNENVVKDVSCIGVAFDAIQNCFRSSQPIHGGCLAELFTNKRELK
jgi:NCK-associated protein 1